jgi:hypothetical protein
MSDSGSSGVNALAIIAVLVLVGLAAWFFLGRGGGDTTKDINVEVNPPSTNTSLLDRLPSLPVA